jgi:cytochrome c oxidase subunit IV
MSGNAISVSSPAAIQRAEPNYIFIWIYLILLTGLELIVAFAPISKAEMVGLLVGLASVKVSMVVIYFMGLHFEPRSLALIAFIPVALAAFLVLTVLPDAATKIYSRHGAGEVASMANALGQQLSGPNPNLNYRPRL